MESLAIGIDTWAAICLCLGLIAGAVGYALTRDRRAGISLFLFMAIVLFWVGGLIDHILFYGSATLLSSVFFLLLPALLILSALCLWWVRFIKWKDRIAIGTCVAVLAVALHVFLVLFMLELSS